MRRGPADPILLVAASARMLAELAVEEGYEVVTADRFGDRDLRAICDGISARTPGTGGGMANLVDAAAHLPGRAVMYGGGLENRPDLVAVLARDRALLGNSPATLARVRDPAILGSALRSAGMLHPEIVLAEGARTAGGRWLRKPVRGGGGRGIRIWRGGALTAGEVIQRHISGTPCSVVAVGDGVSCVVLGVTEQLVGLRALGARRFLWSGNVTPPRLCDSQRCALLHDARVICELLVREFDLRGIFGVDFVWDGHRPWVLEVNPRPPGSLEVLHLSGVSGVVASHVRSFEGQLPDPYDPVAAGRRAAARAILYARRPVVVGDTDGWWARGIRDIPYAGDAIRAGAPICSLRAVGQTPEGAMARLRRRAANLQAEISEWIPDHALA